MTSFSRLPPFVRHAGHCAYRPPGRAWAVLALAAVLLSFLPSPASAVTLSGRITDPDGRPVAGAEVRIEGAGVLPRLAQSDGEGRFTVDLDTGRWEIRVAAPGLRRAPDLVDMADAPRHLDLPMTLSAVSERVVVSATQVEAPRALVPSAVSVIDAVDLEAAQVESVADALHFVAGLGVARAGGRGGQTSVFTRGGESDYTLVLVDGVRVNSLGGGFDWSSLGTAGIDRIEIVRGPQSALFGADAIGGLVQVVTASGGPLRATVRAEGGSEQTWRVTASAAGGWRAWSWGASAEGGGSEGYDGLTWSGRERVSNDDSRSRAGHATLGFGDATWQVRAAGRVAAFERGAPGPFGSDPNGTFGGVDRVARNDTSYTSGSATLVGRLGNRWRMHASGTAFDTEGTFTSTFGPSASGSRRVTARTHLEAALSARVSWTMGVEALDEQGRSSYVVDTGGNLAPIERGAVGAFGEARLDVHRRATITAGVRAERLVRGALPANALGFPPRPAFPSNRETAVNPRVGASVLLLEPTADHRAWTRAHASIATGMRAPDTFEIAFTDNPGLSPEQNRSYDAGVEQGLFDGRLVADVTWFDNRYDDLIVTVGTTLAGTSRYASDNIANARARGIEAGWQARPTSAVQVAGTYTWLDTAVESVDGAAGVAPSPFHVGDALIRRPAHRATFDARWRHARANAFVRVEARAGVLDVDPSFGNFGGKVSAPGYTVVDLGATLVATRRLEVFGRIRNLLDRRYEEAFGFPAPERAVFAGVRVAHGR